MMHKALHPRDDRQSICQEKKEKEDPSALKILLMNQYEDLKTTLKSANKDVLQRLVIALKI